MSLDCPITPSVYTYIRVCRPSDHLITYQNNYGKNKCEKLCPKLGKASLTTSHVSGGRLGIKDG